MNANNLTLRYIVITGVCCHFFRLASVGGLQPLTPNSGAIYANKPGHVPARSRKQAFKILRILARKASPCLTNNQGKRINRRQKVWHRLKKSLFFSRRKNVWRRFRSSCRQFSKYGDALRANIANILKTSSNFLLARAPGYLPEWRCCLVSTAASRIALETQQLQRQNPIKGGRWQTKHLLFCKGT